MTILTGICKGSQYPFATVVPTKGGGSFAVGSFTRWLNELGWDKIVLHVDGENSMSNLLDKVQEKMHGKVTVRRSPRYSPQSMAEGETINGLLAGKIRTGLFDLSEKYAEKITPEHYLFPWTVRHSAWTPARFHVNKMRTTAYKIIKGNDYVSELFALGETVVGEYPRTKDMPKAAPQWVKGIYTGKTLNSEEHILMTEAGSQTYRTVRRLPEGSQPESSFGWSRWSILEWFPGNSQHWQLGITQTRGDRERREVVLIGAPPIAESARTSASTPAMPSTPARQSAAPMTPLAPAAAESKAKVKPLQTPASPRLNVESRDRSQSSEAINAGQIPKKLKIVAQEGPTSAAPGTTSCSVSSSAQLAQAEADLNEAAMQHIPTDDSMNSNDGDNRISAIEAIYYCEELEKKQLKIPAQDVKQYKAWLNKPKEIFETEMVANLMDYLDTLGGDENERLRAKKEELRKLNDEFGAFTPRDGRGLSKDTVVFGHKWVDKVSEGVAKSRLTCQDFKRRGQPEDGTVRTRRAILS